MAQVVFCPHLYHQLLCMVALYNLESMSFQNMCKIDDLGMVAKEITGRCEEILVAMEIDMLSRGIDNRYP